jgi:hypothetical protein
VEAFALFNVFYQSTCSNKPVSSPGPLVGLALTGASFALTCTVAAAVFAMLSIIQIRALPPQSGTRGSEGMLAQWRVVTADRPFLLFATAMICSYVLSFQVYLALPLEIRRIGGDGSGATIGVAALFVASGLVTVLGQIGVTAWCRAASLAGTHWRWGWRRWRRRSFRSWPPRPCLFPRVEPPGGRR